MGMFDYLKCSYPLPVAGAAALEYQTNDTPAQWMDQYEIRADGTLWHEAYDTEDRSDPTAEGFARMIGCATRLNKRWEPVTMTGEVVFYANDFEFSAYFVGGALKHLAPLAIPGGADFCAPAEVPTEAELQAADAEIEAANKGLFPDKPTGQIEQVMRQWDQWRAAIASGDTSSAPRDWFESVLDEQRELGDEIAQLRKLVVSSRYELMGIHEDVKIGGFDEVCMNTLSRVIAAFSFDQAAAERILAERDAQTLENAAEFFSTAVTGSPYEVLRRMAAEKRAKGGAR